MRLPSLRFLLNAAILGILAPAVLGSGPKIGVLLKGRTAFWAAVEKGVVAAGDQIGAEIILKTPMSESDVSVQIQMLNSLAGQGISALVIAPCSKDALAGPVAALAARGIKVVVIDSPLAGDASPVFVATDNQAAGATAGTFLATLVGEADEVGVLKHSQTSGATVERESGVINALRAAHPKLTIHGEIYASAEKGAEAEKARLLLSTYPRLKAVLASGTPGTMAMLQALREKKPAGEIKLVGFGFNLNPEIATAIETGHIDGWIAQFPQDIGAKGVRAAAALVKGETVTPVVHTAYMMVTKANLKSPEVQALLTL